MGYEWYGDPDWPHRPPATCETPESKREKFRVELREAAYRNAFGYLEQLEQRPRPLLDHLLVDYKPPPRPNLLARIGRWLEQLGKDLQWK